MSSPAVMMTPGQYRGLLEANLHIKSFRPHREAGINEDTWEHLSFNKRKYQFFHSLVCVCVLYMFACVCGHLGLYTYM